MKVGRKSVLIALLIAIFCVRLAFVWPRKGESRVSSYVGRKVTLIGEVKEVRKYGRTQRIRLEVSNMTGTVVLTLLPSIEPRYADTIEAKGILERSRRADPRISGTMKFPEVRHMPSRRFSFIRSLHAVRDALIERLRKLLPKSVFAISSGILLGAQEQIPSELISDLRRTGLSHIVALSGFNIVILIHFILGALFWLPRKHAAILSMVIIVVFTLLVGAAASIVRAAIMGSLSLMAMILGRTAASLRSLWIAVMIMIFHDPFIAIFDIGFQLSCAATLGLILLSSRIEKRFSIIPGAFGLRGTLASTISAQAFCLPLIVLYFGRVSLIAPIVNLIVVPLVPLMMLAAGLTIVFGKLAAASTALFYSAVLSTIHFFASLPFAEIEVGIS